MRWLALLVLALCGIVNAGEQYLLSDGFDLRVPVTESLFVRMLRFVLLRII
jgi:hypothetical protein